MTALLRRVLPEVAPHTLATLLSVNTLPPKDFSILSSSDKSQPEVVYDPNKPSILDVFLACIAKALTLQTKVKGASSKGMPSSVKLADFLNTG